MVTGAAGFVGRHVVNRLKFDGWVVSSCDIKYGSDCREWFKLDRKVDLLVHCAAVVGGRMTIDHEPMKVATDLAIDSDFFQYIVRNNPWRAMYFSSSAAYPIALQTGVPPVVRTRPSYLEGKLSENQISFDRPKQPDAIYGWVKLIGERLAQEVNAMGRNVHVFRPFSGYGGDQDLDYPFPSFIERARRRADPFVVWGDGQQTRDFIHIDDIVNAVMAILPYGPAEIGPINLCSGQATSFAELAELVCEQTAFWPEFQFLTDKPVGVRHRVGDPTKMLRYYRPQISLVDGIRRALGNSER